MDAALAFWMTKLRDKNSTRSQFRSCAAQVCQILAYKALSNIPSVNVQIATPITTTSGIAIQKSIMIVPILRSGMAMLPAFLTIFPEASVGVVGLKRDEKTAAASWYYHNLPHFDNDTQVIIIDPMIATGGTASQVISYLLEQGVPLSNMLMVSIVSAPQGIKFLQEKFPKISIICGSYDLDLTAEKYIIPGLGDFGDRFFGTEL
jgi:uracil phosphoribosyltransferase